MFQRRILDPNNTIEVEEELFVLFCLFWAQIGETKCIFFRYFLFLTHLVFNSSKGFVIAIVLLTAIVGRGTHDRTALSRSGRGRTLLALDHRKIPDYRKLPAPLKVGLFALLEQATQLVRRKYPDAMSDSIYTKLFASRLNSRLGKPKFLQQI